MAWSSSSIRTVRPGITGAYVVATAPPLAWAWTRPSSAGAGGSAAATALTRRLRRMIAVSRTSLTFDCSVPVVSGYMATAAVTALYWLVSTLNTAVGLSAITGPAGPSSLAWARIHRLRALRPRWESRTRCLARVLNMAVGFALPSSAGGAAGGWAIRYLAPT